MKTDRCSTQRAITITRIILAKGGSRELIKNVLCIDGFTEAKAEVIVRWAEQINKAEDNGNETAEPTL